MSSEEAWLRSLIRDVPDFPKPGVIFKDITPLLGDGPAFAAVVDGIVQRYRLRRPDLVLGIEARGFIIAAPVAHTLGAGFVPARKAGKLPWETTSVSYDLEYGTETLELHRDAVRPGSRVLIVDDVLATGGTAAATVAIVRELGAEVVGLAVAIELSFLEPRSKLDGVDVFSLLTY